ncbi:hypothetical protein GJ496_011544 [Pomphorhynchus laevis]|nr:hypothetical protein GJ496_011544 [Pomphorhynchus laevis]
MFLVLLAHFFQYISGTEHDHDHYEFDYIQEFLKPLAELNIIQAELAYKYYMDKGLPSSNVSLIFSVPLSSSKFEMCKEMMIDNPNAFMYADNIFLKLNTTTEMSQIPNKVYSMQSLGQTETSAIFYNGQWWIGSYAKLMRCHNASNNLLICLLSSCPLPNDLHEINMQLRSGTVIIYPSCHWFTNGSIFFDSIRENITISNLDFYNWTDTKANILGLIWPPKFVSTNGHYVVFDSFAPLFCPCTLISYVDQQHNIDLKSYTVREFLKRQHAKSFMHLLDSFPVQNKISDSRLHLFVVDDNSLREAGYRRKDLKKKHIATSTDRSLAYIGIDKQLLIGHSFVRNKSVTNVLGQQIWINYTIMGEVTVSVVLQTTSSKESIAHVTVADTCLIDANVHFINRPLFIHQSNDQIWLLETSQKLVLYSTETISTNDSKQHGSSNGGRKLVNNRYSRQFMTGHITQINLIKLLPSIIKLLDDNHAREQSKLFQLLPADRFNMTILLQPIGLMILQNDIINDNNRYLSNFKGSINLLFRAIEFVGHLPKNSKQSIPYYLRYDKLPNVIVTFGDLVLPLFKFPRPTSGAYINDATITYIERVNITVLKHNLQFVLLHLSSFPRIDAVDEMKNRSPMDALMRIPESQPLISILRKNYIHFQIFQTYISEPCTFIIPLLSWYSKSNDSTYRTRLLTSKDVLNQLFMSAKNPYQMRENVVMGFHTAANQPLHILNEINRNDVSMNGANVNILYPPIFLNARFIVYFTTRPITCPGNAASTDSQPVESVLSYLSTNGFTLFADILHRYLSENDLFKENDVIYRKRLTLFAVKDYNLSPAQFTYSSIDYSSLERFLLRHLIISNPDGVDPEDGTFFSEQLGAADTFTLRSASGKELCLAKYDGQLYITDGNLQIGFREFDICKIDGVIHVIKKPLVFENYDNYDNYEIEKQKQNNIGNIVGANNILTGKINKMSSYVYFVVSVLQAKSHIIIVLIVNVTLLILTIIIFL